MTALQDAYETRRKQMLLPLAERLEAHLKSLFDGCKRIDRISVRAKSVDRFVAKASKQVEGKPKYEDPLKQIQDQLGARIVTFYKSDVETLTNEVKKYFSYIESVQINPTRKVSLATKAGISSCLFPAIFLTTKSKRMNPSPSLSFR
jgi:ppGpp synthetase/RelA/SpoT-type nucleotidyltranferase